ncbi:Golgi resident protein GCP60 [Nymphon striatum]|nr:Golgi resident protein GCP60 [Nymphon striatum]
MLNFVQINMLSLCIKKTKVVTLLRIDRNDYPENRVSPVKDLELDMVSKDKEWSSSDDNELSSYILKYYCLSVRSIVIYVYIWFCKDQVYEMNNMATMTDSSELDKLDSTAHKFQAMNLKPSTETLDNGYVGSNNSIQEDHHIVDWGFGLEKLYKLALQFHKEKEGKAIHLSYEDKLALVAFTQQVIHGQCNVEKSPPVGYLDVIGRDRRQAWASLGDMTREKAMISYIKLLDSVCTLFKAFVEAHKRDINEKERKQKEEAERIRKEREEEEIRLKIEKEAAEMKEKEMQKQETQRRQIQDALNQQTYHQFRAFAEQQYPGNPEQQAVLVRQLQEQHYQQYMQQVYQQQLLGQQYNNSHDNKNKPGLEQQMDDPDNCTNTEGEEDFECDFECSSPEGPSVASASMWTRKDIQDFKDSIKREKNHDGIIKVGHGEMVTVRVPTHEDATCFFWEFATNDFDIGFGLSFEWSKPGASQISIQIGESEDSDEEDYDDEPYTISPWLIQTNVIFPDAENDDLERGTASRLSASVEDKPPVTPIIPVYRRDCQEEVYAGSHVYPGEGVYLLKFDNSYSLLRSKTVYYRVYYSR